MATAAGGVPIRKHMKLHRLVLMLALALAHTAMAEPAAPASVPAGNSADFQLAPSASESEAARITGLFLSRFYYAPERLRAGFSGRIVDHLVSDLDPERTAFTKADIERLEPLRSSLAQSISDGNIEAGLGPINVFLDRVTERYTYAAGLLGAGFDLTTHDSVAVERKAAPWASSMGELHELWRKQTEDDWLRLKLAGKSDADVRAILSKRYQGMASRLRKTSPEDAFQLLMTAFCEAADPHTDYFVPKAASQFKSDMSLSLVGIGAYLREHDEFTQVSELVPGGPADASGKLHAGDRIVAVGQDRQGPMVDVVGWRADDVVALIRGKPGTTLRIARLSAKAGSDTPAETVVLRRRKVTIENQAAQSTTLNVMEGGKATRIGIITVPSFYEDFDAQRSGDPRYRSVSRDVKRILARFSADHVGGVLLDLRGNGGGSLAEATRLVGLFVGRGPVVQVRDARGRVEVDEAPGAAAAWHGPVGVLINHGSASASEIFAAAIQDLHRGVIVGERSFGKGTVQNLIDLDAAAGASGEGSLGELKMTIAEFYRLNGVSTQSLGVAPDIAFPATGDERLFGENTYDNALPASTIAPAPVAPKAMPAGVMARLSASHNQRVARSALWKLTLDEIAEGQREGDEKSVSLNFEERKAARAAKQALFGSFEARLRSIQRVHGDPASALDAFPLDDGLNPSERDLAEAPRPGAHKATDTDAYLLEAANIVADDFALTAAPVQDGTDDTRISKKQA